MRLWKINKIAKWIISDWQKKIISLVVAMLLWYIVNYQAYDELTFSLPIQYKNLPKELQIIEIYDTLVPILVKGPRERIKSLDFSKMVKVSVNLEKASPGINTFLIETELKDPKPDVSFTLLKEKASLKIDQVSSKIVFVRPILTGEPSTNYVKEEMFINPRMVTIKGPKSLIDQINYVETTPLSIEGVSSDITEKIPLNLPKNVSVEGDDKVYLTIRIVKKSVD